MKFFSSTFSRSVGLSDVDYALCSSGSQSFFFEEAKNEFLVGKVVSLEPEKQLSLNRSYRDKNAHYAMIEAELVLVTSQRVIEGKNVYSFQRLREVNSNLMRIIDSLHDEKNLYAERLQELGEDPRMIMAAELSQ